MDLPFRRGLLQYFLINHFYLYEAADTPKPLVQRFNFGQMLILRFEQSAESSALYVHRFNKDAIEVEKQGFAA